MNHNSQFCFCDKNRGLWATNDGKLYITNPGTKELIKGPLIFTAPCRILVSDEYDPFAIILTPNGYLFIYNIEMKRVIMNTLLPSNAGVVEKINFNTSKNQIILQTNHGVFKHVIPSDNSEDAPTHWNIVDEPLEYLETNIDTKPYAQCAKLEGNIAASAEEGDFEQYSDFVKKYFLYVATYLPNNTFIALWYAMIKSQPPFPEDDVQNLWRESVGLLSSIERVAPLIDELEMSLTKQ